MTKDIRQHFANTVTEAARADNRLAMVLGVVNSGLFKGFAAECPERYFDVGISEQSMVSIAAGMSRAGLIPVMHTFAPFIIERAFEQLKIGFSYQKLCGNVITTGSAFDYGTAGCTHHCYNDYALIKTLENTKIFFPCSPAEFDVLFSENYDNGCLNLFRIPFHIHGHEFKQEEIKTGKALKISEGCDVTVVVAGPNLKDAIEAQVELQRENITTEIIYLHTLSPIDYEAVSSSLSKTRRLLVIEQHMQSGGIGETILMGMRNIDGFKAEFINIPDRFIRSYADYHEHCKLLGMDKDGIACKVRELL